MEENGEDFQAVIDGLLSASLTATKASNVLYARNDHGYLSSYPEWKQQNEAVSKRLTDLLQVIQRQVGFEGDSFSNKNADIDDHHADVSETIEFLLEQAEANISSPSSSSSSQENYEKQYLMEMITSPKIQDSPQFRHHANQPPNNARGVAFEHKPWDRRDVFAEQSRANCHPFDAEITRLQYLPEHVSAPRQVRPCPKPLTNQDMQQGWTMVEDAASLKQLQNDITNSTEIAVDLEHHSFRSFQGLTCLMQLTTSTGHDYIIDCLSPHVRPFLGAALGPTFANPSVVKVFHGANSDVMWLQRDFGLYLVNMFDTGQAARYLGYASASLSFLLEKHAQLKDVADMKRKYQMSDWRVRPLSSGQLLYARSDTHYLLPVYDVLRCELAAKGSNAIGDVLKASESVCRLCYRKDDFDSSALVKATARFNQRDQLSPLTHHLAAVLWDWRDQVVRREDESTGYVLANHMIFKIALEQPQTSAQLISFCKGGGGGLFGNNAPPLVVKYSEEIVKLLSEVKVPPVPAKVSTTQKVSSTVFTFTPNTIQIEEDDSMECSNALDSTSSAEKTSSSLANKKAVLSSRSEVYQAAGWIHPFASSRAMHGSVEEEEAAHVAEKIRKDLAERPMLPLVQRIFHEEKEAAAKRIEFPDKDDVSILKNDNLNADSMLSTDIATDEERVASQENNDDEANQLHGIPRSMSEIYKISNRNRHRNKEKKKLREAVVVPSNDSTDQSFDYFSSKKQKNEDDTDEVLREVGWVKGSDGALLDQVSRSTSIAQKGTMGHYKTSLNSSVKPIVNPYLVNDMS